MQPAPLGPASQEPLLDGSWEHSGRSLNTAAILALIGVGALYFNVQSILGALVVMVASALNSGPAAAGSGFDRIVEQVRFLAQPIRIVITVTQYGFMLLPALWIVKRWHSSTVRRYVRLDRVPVLQTVVAVLITLAFLPANNFIADQFVRQLHVPSKLMAINAELFTSRSPGEFVWLIVVVCITPALCEETFFRGVVQRTFERTMGWKSAILVGVLFGFFHMNPLGLITLAILGMLLGYFYYRSRSLVPSMAAHFTNNFVAILVLYKNSGGDSDQFPLWMIGGTLVIGIALLLLFDNMTRGAGTQGA